MIKISKIFLPYNVAFEFRNIIASWKNQSSIKNEHDIKSFIIQKKLNLVG